MRSRQPLNPGFLQSQQGLSTRDVNSVVSEAADTGRVCLSNRNLAVFPANVLAANFRSERWWEVEAVRILDLSFNPQLRSIPREISALAEGLHTLKLRQCGLTALPPELGVCILLKIIDVSHNRLSSLPDSLTTLPELLELDASHNQLAALPGGWAGTPKLTVLRVSGNALRALPEDLGGARALKELSAASNALEGALPSSLSHSCHALATLCVPGNRLTALAPPGQALWASLEVLDARDNRLARLPCLAAPSQHLTTLLLGGNPLQLHPSDDTLSRASWRLCTLDLSRCGLSAVPEALRGAAARALSTLDLSSNDLNNLPSWLGWAEALKTFLLEGNPMRALGKRALLQPGATCGALLAFLKTRASPEEVAQYESMGLAIPACAVMGGSAAASAAGGGGGGGCGGGGGSGAAPFPSAPPAAAAAAQGAWTEALREASVSGKLVAPQPLPAGSAPSAAFAAPAPLPLTLDLLRGASLRSTPDLTLRLRVLVLDGCPGLAASLPCGLLACCPSLEEVSLARCALKSLPGALAEGGHPSRALRALRLPHNALEALPPLERAVPGSLRVLDLRHNALTAFPDARGLRALTELLLGFNPGIGALQQRQQQQQQYFPVDSLCVLDVKACGLRTLPAAVLALGRLTTLDCSDNELAEIPPQLGLLPLTDLRCGGNPQRGVRQATLDKGTAAIMEFLKSRVPSTGSAPAAPSTAFSGGRGGGRDTGTAVQGQLQPHPQPPSAFSGGGGGGGRDTGTAVQGQLQPQPQPQPQSQPQQQERRDQHSGLSWEECCAQRAALEQTLDDAFQRGASGGTSFLMRVRKDLALVKAAMARLAL
jgi:Leucine-rich repeat (LRR) protein